MLPNRQLFSAYSDEDFVVGRIAYDLDLPAGAIEGIGIAFTASSDLKFTEGVKERENLTSGKSGI